MSPDFFLTLSAVSSFWLPALLALFLTMTAPRPGSAYQGLAIATAFGVGTFLARQPVLPPFPPVGATGWLPYAVMAVAILHIWAGARANRLLPYISPAIIIGFLGPQAIYQGVGAVLVAGFLCYGLVLADRTTPEAAKEGSWAAIITALAPALGLFAAASSVSSGHALHALSLAAAVAGSALGAGIRRRDRAVDSGGVRVALAAGLGLALAIYARLPSLLFPLTLALLTAMAGNPPRLFGLQGPQQAVVHSVLAGMLIWAAATLGAR